MNEVVDEDSINSSEDGKDVIGIRSSRRQTNWRFRYDALNQQDVALRAHLQVQSDGIFTQIHGLLLVVAILTTMLAVCHWFRVFRAATVHNLVKIIQLIIVVVTMFQGQQMSIASEMDDILLIHSNHRVLHPFPPKKNRRFDDLSEEEAYTWTPFTKAQLHQLYIHLCLPLNVTSPIRQTLTV
jgi:hypothetical protein